MQEQFTLKIDSDFGLTGAGFICNGTPFAFSDVAQLYYRHECSNYNEEYSGTNEIRCLDWSGKQFVRSKTPLFTWTTRGNRARMAAYQLIASRTFQARLGRYLSMLNSQSFFDYGQVKVFANGDIRCGEVTLNLARAKKFGALNRGTYMDTHQAKITNPYRFWVSETMTFRHTDIYDFLGVEKQRKDLIAFCAHWDTDVLEAIFHFLADRNRP